MRFYLLDDDKNVRMILRRIITDQSLGTVCGEAGDPSDALEDLSCLMPEIVIVDLLMPGIDGITFVSRAHALYSDMTFIMLSQVSSKDMISDAYKSGVRFYIQKPINAVEVISVLREAAEAIRMKRTFVQMKGLFMGQSAATPVIVEKKYMTKLKEILNRIGIGNELGSHNIIDIIEFLVEHGKSVNDYTLSELCSVLGENSKSVEQRIRRAAAAGMLNLAHRGLEDYYDDIFTKYSNMLYNFEQVRREMNFIRGKEERHGNVRIKNFLNALMDAALK